MVRKPGLAFLTTVALALAGVIGSSSDETAQSAQDRSGGMTDISAQAQQKKGGPGRSAAPSGPGRSASQPRIQRNVSQPRIQRNVGPPESSATSASPESSATSASPESSATSVRPTSVRLDVDCVPCLSAAPAAQQSLGGISPSGAMLVACVAVATGERSWGLARWVP